MSSRQHERSPVLFWALLLSIGAHALTGAVASASLARMPSAPIRLPDESPIEFMVLEPLERPDEPIRLPEPPPERPSADPPPRTPSAPSAIAPRRTERRPSDAVIPTERPSEAEPAPDSTPPEPDDGREETPEELEARRRAEGISTKNGLRVDPRAVALSALSSEMGRNAPRASYQEDRRPTVADRRSELNREHSGFLSAQANSKDWAVPREAPRFMPRRDGSYTYQGHAFSARINPDGTIVFSDREGMNFSDLGTDDGKSAGVRFSFDLADGAHRRRGSDPYRAEREYVMKGSEELREKLMAEHRKKEMERGLRRIETKLMTIWNASRDLSAKRRAIFRVWDELSEDEMGERARALILRFIRENAPEESEAAFTPSEIEALNARRTSRAPFAPYR